MKLHFLLLVIFLNIQNFSLNANTALSSCLTCLPGDLVFTNQTEIDDWVAMNGGCLKITGNLEFKDGIDITDLSGFLGLEEITGDLIIDDNEVLVALNGLDSLSMIGGQLQIIHNDTLLNLNGLEKLTYIGDFMLINNQGLISLEGLENIDSMGTANISSAEAQLDFAGLSSLKYVSGSLSLSSDLPDFSGLESLDSVGGNLLIHYCENTLKTLNGLNNLKSLGGLEFRYCDGLEDITALSTITKIGEQGIDLYENDALKSLDGLEGITYLTGLRIDRCDSLLNLNGLNNIDSVGIIIRIEENDALVSLEGLEKLKKTGILDIDNNDVLTDISALSNLTSVGNLFIQRNLSLLSLAVFENIDNVNTLRVTANESLSNLYGLHNIVQVQSSCNISYNTIMEDLSGLESLESIGTSLVVRYNPVLKNFNGIQNLESIGIDLAVHNNDSLVNFEGLEGLTSIEGEVFAYKNPVLVSLEGLENLVSVGLDFRFNDNISLKSISDLKSLESVGLDFIFFDNDSLQDISGITNLTFIGDFLGFWDNPLLQYCGAPFICWHILGGGDYGFSDNAVGCNEDIDFEKYCSINTINGNVFRDEDENCELFDEPALANWKIKASSNDWTTYAYSDNEGHFSMKVDSGNYNLSLIPPFEIWEACPEVENLNFDSFGDTITNTIGAIGLIDCPLLQVEISSSNLVRCFQSTLKIKYCNLGTSAANDAFIKLYLDPLFLIDETSLPFFEVPGEEDIYQFDIGDIESGNCGEITLTILVSCEAILGQTLCLSANIFPDTLCNIPNPLWSGSDIFVNGNCEEEEVIFSIQNQGLESMSEPFDYQVFKDGAILETGTFQLEASDEQFFSYPSDGATYRLEANQAHFHPENSFPSLTMEGCVDDNSNFSTGYFLQFPVEDYGEPFHRLCQEIIGSYDPNDKQAIPVGYGEEHYIEKNIPLTYLIRFQNTGTDTARKVVVLDTLSTHLDIASFEVGAVSHDYRLQILSGGILEFTFDEIMLPDSNVNEPASHGFITFKISQKPDLPIGTVINNSAGIYFDFNEPIITNTMFHEIGENFYDIIDATENIQESHQVYAAPNPFHQSFNFIFQNDNGENKRLTLFDSFGRMMLSKNFNLPSLKINQPTIPSGVYFYKIMWDNGYEEDGKVVKF